MYQIQTAKFQGPLDVLLNLIEEKKLSVNELALAEVSEQYFAYIKSLADFPKSEAAEFLVIASTLMLIKSKSLLPGFELGEKEETDVRELEMRLGLLKMFRRIARELGAFAALNRASYFRERLAGFEGGFYPPKSVNPASLASIIRSLIDKIPATSELPEKAIEKIISIEEKMTELINRISARAGASLRGLTGTASKQELIVTFLAMLELLKQGLISARQEGDFGEISIRQT